MNKLLALILGIAVLATLGGLATAEPTTIRGSKSNGSYRAAVPTPTPTPKAKTTTVNTTKSAVNVKLARTAATTPTPTPKPVAATTVNGSKSNTYRTAATTPTPTPKAKEKRLKQLDARGQ
ncbi:MAG TPA: hypothetical protein VF345_07560 [Chthoniobacterales bacterium]